MALILFSLSNGKLATLLLMGLTGMARVVIDGNHRSCGPLPHYWNIRGLVVRSKGVTDFLCSYVARRIEGHILFPVFYLFKPPP